MQESIYLSDNFINKEHKYEENAIIIKQKELEIKTKRNILIVTHLLEKPNQKYIHYSMIKGYLLANGLLDLNYNIYFMSDVENIQKWNNYYYINYNMLDTNTLYKFDMIVFILHNIDYITEIYYYTKIITNILLMKSDKKQRPIIINKTCVYPIIYDSLNVDSYNLFDVIFLQTDQVVIPKMIRNNFNFNIRCVKSLVKYCKKMKQPCKFYWSEMTFNTETFNYNNSNDIKISNDVTNLIYIGRLNSNYGFDILYLIKIMKILGKDYKLYILPGSFCLPTEYPIKKYFLDSEENFLKLKEFFNNYKIKYNKRNYKLHEEISIKNIKHDNDDYNKCNIEILKPVEYGEHFKIINKMDIGIGFSFSKTSSNPNVPVGSSKLFDYMCSNVKIVFEKGCHNTKYITEYKFGKLISSNSTLKEMVNSIKEVNKMSKKDILYDKFINEHNHFRRAEKFVKNIYRIVDDFQLKDNFLITDNDKQINYQEIAKKLYINRVEETCDEKAEQLLMSNEDINYISNS